MLRIVKHLHHFWLKLLHKLSCLHQIVYFFNNQNYLQFLLIWKKNVINKSCWQMIKGLINYIWFFFELKYFVPLPTDLSWTIFKLCCFTKNKQFSQLCLCIIWLLFRMPECKKCNFVIWDEFERMIEYKTEIFSRA